jgi:hypothetical protein
MATSIEYWYRLLNTVRCSVDRVIMILVQLYDQLLEFCVRFVDVFKGLFNNDLCHCTYRCLNATYQQLDLYEKGLIIIDHEYRYNFYIYIILLITLGMVIFYKRRICVLILDIKDLNVKNESLQKNPALNMCCICQVESSNMIINPCSHLCLCLKCSDFFGKTRRGISKKCPICRESIVGYNQIYQA